jgi:hypothetical protein
MFLRVRNWVVAAVLATPTAALAADGCCNSCAPTSCQATCVEYVPEQFTTTRTCYRTECKEEAYTSYRCEMTQEQRVCTKNVMKPVCETVMVQKTICEAVPCTEQRTTMRTVWKTVPVTTTQKVMVDRGHYECCEVRARRTICDRLSKQNTDCCPRMETKKVWVPCCVCEDRVVTCCQRVCEQVPVTCCVTTCKMVSKTITVPCTTTRCVCEQVQCPYTVCVPKLIPVQCTRTVRVCVPFTETVTCCRMVPKCVPAPAAPCCAASTSCGCGSSCGATSCCTTTCCSAKKGLFHKNRGQSGCGGCSSCCN